MVPCQLVNMDFAEEVAFFIFRIQEFKDYWTSLLLSLTARILKMAVGSSLKRP